MNESIRYIGIDELQIGMFIADTENDWVPDSNFRRQGLVSRPEVIEQIRSLGVTALYIDISKGKGTDNTGHRDKPAVSPSAIGQPNVALPKPTVSFAKEIDNAKDIRLEATSLIGRCMTDIKMGKSLDIVPFCDIACHMADSIFQNHNALLCVTQLRQKDRYLMEHSFNVSVLMGVLATAMGYKGKALEELVTGALLHDMGKICVPDAILHKPGKLDPEEWQEMQRHVHYGESLLAKTPGISQVIMDICANHHERIDGNGYPRSLSGDDIPVHSRMASVVDVYDAVTSERVYHKGMAPTLALKKILEWSTQQQLDQQIVYRFIQAMGVYPVGSVVELDNQKLALVTEANPDQQDKPKVMQMYDLRSCRYSNRLAINLADKRCGRHIVKAVYAEQYGIKLKGII